MTKYTTLQIDIKSDLAEKFELALSLNKETPSEVIRNMLTQYISDSFLKASKNVTIDSTYPSESRQTTKITDEMIEVSYHYARKVYHGELTRIEGKVKISQLTGMKEGSAQDYITDFLSMMEGKEYHRTMSNKSTVFFIKNIKKDYGEAAFQRALTATEKHIKYYNSLGYGQLKEKEKLVKKLKEEV